MNSFRLSLARTLRTALIALTLSLVPALLVAQPSDDGAAEGPPRPPGASAEEGATDLRREAATSGLWLEWGVVIIGVGVAVFAVCRSSRRN